jgi:uncharacterized membrane protein
MWLDILARLLHISGAAFWVGGSLALSWIWLPALRASASGLEAIKIMQRALPRLQGIFRLASLLLLLSGGYRASGGFMSSALPLEKLIGLLLMVGLWIVLTGLFEMTIPRIRRHLAVLGSNEGSNAPLATALTSLGRLGALSFWLGLLLILDGAYLPAS